MGDGSSKSIQDVVVGDEVWAWNQATGENEPRRVVETFVHEDVETWEVETADGQVVTSTAEHPFWVEGKGWTPVRELKAGDVLAAADGPVGVVRVEATGETARVFNVHVDGLHNYHVGEGSAALRVHNDCVPIATRFKALDWSATANNGESRIQHVMAHSVPNANKNGHGVFYDNPIEVAQEAWSKAHSEMLRPIPQGNREVFNIPMGRNVGYAGGADYNKFQGVPLDGVRVVVKAGTSEVITAFPIRIAIAAIGAGAGG